MLQQRLGQRPSVVGIDLPPRQHALNRLQPSRLDGFHPNLAGQGTKVRHIQYPRDDRGFRQFGSVEDDEGEKLHTESLQDAQERLMRAVF